MPTQSIDYGQLQAFFVAERLPGIKDIHTKAEPTLNMFYSVALAGSLTGASEIKDYAKAIKNPPSPKFKERFLSGTLFFESAAEYLAVGGTVNGSGAQSISNTPQDRHVVARWRFNKKETPCAIASDKWRASQNKGGAKDKTKSAESLITNEAGAQLKAQVKELSTDLFSPNTDEENVIHSLKALTGVSASDETTYGGISRSTISQWSSNYATYTTADATDPLSSNYLPTLLGGKLDTLLDNGAKMDDMVIIMGSTAHSSYRKIVLGLPNTANASPTNAGNFNINNGRNFPYSQLYYSGIPIIRDQRAGANDIFIIDSNSTFMAGLANSLFDMSDWQLSENVTQQFARLTTISTIIGTVPRNNYYLAAA